MFADRKHINDVHSADDDLLRTLDNISNVTLSSAGGDDLSAEMDSLSAQYVSQINSPNPKISGCPVSFIYSAHFSLISYLAGSTSNACSHQIKYSFKHDIRTQKSANRNRHSYCPL
jgi:hypothetical protein